MPPTPRTPPAAIDDRLASILIEDLAQGLSSDSRHESFGADPSDSYMAHGETVVDVPAVSSGDSFCSTSPESDELQPLPLEELTGPAPDGAETDSAASEPAGVQDEPVPAPAAPVDASSEGKAPQHWQLRIVQESGTVCVLPLEDRAIRFGRGHDNDVVLRCDRISRYHAVIRLDAKGPRVDDAGSSNGILVNGTKVPAAYLHVGDIVTLGSYKIHVEAEPR
jgi:hypothetical protein